MKTQISFVIFGLTSLLLLVIVEKTSGRSLQLRSQNYDDDDYDLAEEAERANADLEKYYNQVNDRQRQRQEEEQERMIESNEIDSDELPDDRGLFDNFSEKPKYFNTQECPEGQVWVDQLKACATLSSKKRKPEEYDDE